MSLQSVLESGAFAVTAEIGPLKGTDVTEAEHGGAVGDDCDEISPGCVGVDVSRLLLDLEARFGDAGRVREGKVALVIERLSGDDGNLAGASTPMIFESFLSSNGHEASFLDRMGHAYRITRHKQTQLSSHTLK